MKFATTAIMAALMAGSGPIAYAQEENERPGGAQGEERGPGGRRPPPPLIAALDLDKDGVISAQEIAKASESLKKLDKNNDGQLTPDEMRPPRRPRDHSDGPKAGPRDGDRPQGAPGQPPAKQGQQPPPRP